MRPRSALLWIGLLLWTTGVGYGMSLVWAYTNTPNPRNLPPTHWPDSSPLTRKPGVWTLVLALHPRCPCSRATLQELANAIATANVSVETQCLLFHPASEPDSWSEGVLAESARRLQGGRIVTDPDGVIAKSFAANTSGEVLLYDSAGNLRFSGGVTGGRGHLGANPGATRLSALLNGGSRNTEFHVFGCPIVGPKSPQRGEPVACRR